MPEKDLNPFPTAGMHPLRPSDEARARAEGLHRRAEAPIEKRPGLLPDALEELTATVEELRVAEEEMRAQNEELLLAHGRIEAERHRYQDLFEFAPDGYLVTTPDGKVLEANCAASDLLGIAPRFLKGRGLGASVFSEELALTADFRVLGERAKVGVPEIQLGIIPGAGGTQRLTRLVGPARAKSMVFTGRHVGAEEALAVGIADAVVPDAGVYEAARELAAQFVVGPAVALRNAKQAIDDGLEMDLDAGLRLESALFTGLFGTDDQRTGMASFLAAGPGKATFSGR